MATHPLPSISPTQGVHAALDALALLDPGGLNGTGQAQLLREVKRIASRVDAYRLKVLAAAERARTAEKAGDADTASWAAKNTNEDSRDAGRAAKLARRLKDRSPTQQALAQGEISQEHAETIVGAGEQLPEDLTTAERAQVEDDLVDKAKTMSPAALRRRARRALETLDKEREEVDGHEEGLVAGEEERARAKTRLTLRDNGDGTVNGHFTLPAFHGHLLRKIVQTMTAPRRRNHTGDSGTLDSGTRADLSGLPDPHRVAQDRRADWANLHGLALAELIEHLPTDHLTPKTAATMVVILEEQVLRGYQAAAALDTGEKISAAHARQLVCNAGIVPAVLGGKSLPLDLGRGTRHFSEAQRTALATRYSSCAADGCERPYAWSELHHAIPWSEGGPTDLDNAVPLCHRHHRMAHDRKYQQSRAPDGGYRFAMVTAA